MPADGQLAAMQVDAHGGGQGVVPVQAQLQLQHTKAQGWQADGHGHLVDVRDHVSGRAPACADLHSQGLALLREDTDQRRADEQGHHAEPLLIQRVEQYHVPG